MSVIFIYRLPLIKRTVQQCDQMLISQVCRDVKAVQADQTEHVIEASFQFKAVYPSVTIPASYVVKAFEQTTERQSIIVPFEITGVRYEVTVALLVNVKSPIADATCE